MEVEEQTHWVDCIYLPELESELIQLDQRLDQLREACGVSPDPDGLGILDAIEDVIGLGFFRCQHYMVRRKGCAKGAYAYGPRFRSHPYSQVINAAANYWKHVGEWPDDPELSAGQRKTLATIVDAGVTDRDYPLSNLLYALHPDARLARLLPLLAAWREEFDKADQPSRRSQA